MKSAWRLAAATGASLMMAGVAMAAPPPPAAPLKAAPAKAAPGDRAQIEALERGFAAAFNAKNVDRIMTYYARDGLFVFDVGTPREHDGWASYRKDWQDLFAERPGALHFAISDLAITVAGPVAWSHSIQTVNSTTKDGAKRALVVRVTDVYRKLDGRWKIVQEHVSVPIDFATGKPDMMSKP